MFIFSEEENESNEMKIISCRTTKKLNKDNIEETVILENQRFMIINILGCTNWHYGKISDRSR